MDTKHVFRYRFPLHISLLGLILSLLFGNDPLAGQELPQVQETNQEIFATLPLPTPNGQRTATGEPGPAYWQQEVDYRIRVALDTASKRVTGAETIDYTNNSPGSLDHLWLQLDQNLARPDSRGAMVVTFGPRPPPMSSEAGYELSAVRIVGAEGSRPVEYSVDDTRMRIDLPEPVAAGGGRVQLEIEWSFFIPGSGAGRMGRLETPDGWIYELAQWYPRLAVFDDVSGWNTLPYLGMGEFYLEYGSFDVEITVPRGLIVVATGTLENPAEVLTAGQRRRLETARRSAETVLIVGPDEVGTAASRPDGEGPLTWRFHADRVRDFAWAASRAFVWDAAGWEDVLIQSVYPRNAIGPDEKGEPGWEMSTQFARHTISYYSGQWLRYPYPVVTNVGGTVGGMEYPMIVFCSSRARGRGLFGVTDHELGHSWFPMIVGSDERRYAWMDEGFNTFINHYSNIAYYGDEGAPARSSVEVVTRMMREPIADQPIMTRPDVLRLQGLGFLGYAKPGYGLVLLREQILGPERFDAAFRTYIRRWAFRHPQPADFFRTIEDVAGEDLDWFWRGWFYSTDVLDLAVDSVSVKEGITRIHLSNREGLVMPATLDISFRDGSSARRKLPVEAWAAGDEYTLSLGPTAPVASVTIDPERRMPDVDRENDSWSAPEEAGPE